MNGVNLNGPDLKLTSSSEQAPARAISSSQDEKSAIARSVVSSSQSPELSGSAVLKKPAGVSDEKLADAVTQLNDFVQSVQRDLQFEVDQDLGQTIVKVVDQSTQKLIRQIPDEVALRLAEKLQQEEPLTLFSVKV